MQGPADFAPFAFAGNPYQQAPPAQNTLHGGGADPNAPELFRANVQIVHAEVLRVQELAKRAMDGVRNAYSPGRTPAQTDADLAALKQALEHLAALMRQSGVGGLPLLPNATAAPPSEDALLGLTTRTLAELYERHKRMQEGAHVVANRLGHHVPAQSQSQSTTSSQSQGHSQSQGRK
ncbi:FAD-binding-3 domain-containing protein [Mycena indigotica]|uniref:FAD-binding-3 domain-containing protein n=1 Tax=Mycena indigotica TaxID=2126181 RepID=A0A8H6W746_9AGAR|nr:FAD-binding-3 domain-containing protein [Mycena indigotica]KAF7304113.1 FAD-binding-3 domain-containing protein [Mycena indigotica]